MTQGNFCVFTTTSSFSVSYNLSTGSWKHFRVYMIHLVKHANR
ncbi:uncharacterized protein J3R85_006263 [Psidium guajava]|nr:uncharacterized protein J3R85_006263 [Psidium guajava]